MDGLLNFSTLLVILAMRTTTVAGGVCVNALQGQQCDQKAGRGECTTRRTYMAANCARSCEECANADCGPLEIALVVDSSVSIGKAGHDKTKESIIALLQSFTIGATETRVSLIQFGHGIYSRGAIQLSSNDNWDTLKEKILNLRWQKGTRTETGQGIAYMVNTLMSEARTESTRVAVVITDGNSQRRHHTKAEADKAKAAGITMFSVGVGHSIRRNELLNIASDETMVFKAASFGDLAVVMKQVQETICKSSGSRCNVEADLVFAVDTSDSIGREPFKKGVRFLANFVREFDIERNNIRVAFLLYSSRVWNRYTIHFGQTGEELYSAIENLPWRRGGTRTDLAIDAVVREFSREPRPGVPQIAFVVSDGDSTSASYTKRSADLARAQNIKLVAVGIGNNIHDTELTNIAGSGGSVVQARDYNHLTEVRDSLVEAACSRHK